MSAVSVVSVVL